MKKAKSKEVYIAIKHFYNALGEEVARTKVAKFKTKEEAQRFIDEFDGFSIEKEEI